MFIRIRDQNGNAPPKCGHGVQERLYVALIPDGGDGTPKGDRFTDDAGQTAVEQFEEVYGSKGCTLAVNEHNVNPNYGTARVHVDDVESAEIDIVVERKLQLPPAALTSYGTCAEWKSKVFAIFQAHGYASCGPEFAGGVQAPYLRTTQNEIQQIFPSSSFVRWQFDTFNNLRPRLFLPHGGTDPYARYADIGDWGGPLKWDHCQDLGKKKADGRDEGTRGDETPADDRDPKTGMRPRR